MPSKNSPWLDRPHVRGSTAVDMTTPPVISLTYFDIPGPAEAIRLAFYVGDVSFEDRRVSRDEFAVMKPGRCRREYRIVYLVYHVNAFPPGVTSTGASVSCQ